MYERDEVKHEEHNEEHHDVLFSRSKIPHRHHQQGSQKTETGGSREERGQHIPMLQCSTNSVPTI